MISYICKCFPTTHSTGINSYLNVQEKTYPYVYINIKIITNLHLGSEKHNIHNRDMNV